MVFSKINGNIQDTNINITILEEDDLIWTEIGYPQCEWFPINCIFLIGVISMISHDWDPILISHDIYIQFYHVMLTINMIVKQK